MTDYCVKPELVTYDPSIRRSWKKAESAGYGTFYRDTVLPRELFVRYQLGLLFREPTFCDATYKFGGLAAPHRYLVISANARCIDSISQHPEWGLCVWQLGRIFKIIGSHEHFSFTQVTLFEIPEEHLQGFAIEHLTELEYRLSQEAAEQFSVALQTEARPEHTTRLWLDRLVCPVGLDDKGDFFESWSYCS